MRKQIILILEIFICLYKKIDDLVWIERTKENNGLLLTSSLLFLMQVKDKNYSLTELELSTTSEMHNIIYYCLRLNNHSS